MLHSSAAKPMPASYNRHACLHSGRYQLGHSFTHANDGCYGTNQVPLSPPFLVAVFRFTPSRAEEFWTATLQRLVLLPLLLPLLPSFHTLTRSRADMRLQASLSAPPVITIPEEDDDMHDAPPDIEASFSQEVENAFTHLERAIDNMHTAQPTHPAFDPQFYSALSNLPLTYPWPILTIDLKNFLPPMDRHVLTHMVAARAAVDPQFTHPAPVLANFFTDLAHTIVHHILAPLNSQYMRPNLPQRIFSTEFWHAHLNYAALPPLHLRSVRWTAWPATSYANGTPSPSNPATASQFTPTFSVQQHLQFPLPQVFQNEAELLSLARQSAADGYLLNSWLAISVLIAQTSAGCLDISASPCLPPAIHRISALFAITPFVSTLYSPYRQPLQRLSGLDTARKAQRPYHDRTPCPGTHGRALARLHPAFLPPSVVSLPFLHLVFLSDIPSFALQFSSCLVSLHLISGYPVGHSGPLGTGPLSPPLWAFSFSSPPPPPFSMGIQSDLRWLV